MVDVEVVVEVEEAGSLKDLLFRLAYFCPIKNVYLLDKTTFKLTYYENF